MALTSGKVFGFPTLGFAETFKKPCDLCSRRRMPPSHQEWRKISQNLVAVMSLTLQPLLFWKKQGKPTKKARVFLSAEPVNSLKKGKRITIPRGWYRAQKPVNPGNTKKIRKKYKIPHPKLPPENTKKLPKKYKKGQKLPSLYFFR